MVSQNLQIIFIKVLHSINIRPIFALSKADREIYLSTLIHKFDTYFAERLYIKIILRGECFS
jgi:hypothetical protein